MHRAPNPSEANGDPPRSAVERFLIGAPGASPDLATLRTLGLSPLAYRCAPDHPERAELRADLVRASARHLAIQRAVTDLVTAWNGGGVAALVFKGFYLAEFVYPSAGERPYFDVDLVVAPDRVAAACDLAEARGWRVTWRLGEPDRADAARAGGYTGHEAAQLRHGTLDVSVDLHRRLAHNTHNRLPYARAQERLTAAAWAASHRLDWRGTTLHVLDPRDAVVIGLAVNRGWGSDRWRPKPRDYPDFSAIVDRHGVTRAAIVERARELGVSRTLAVFLERCDPFRERLRTVSPTWTEQRRWNLKVAPERGWVDLERGVVDAYEAIGHGALLLRVLPLVRAVVADVDTVAARPPRGPTQTHPLRARPWRALRRAIHRSLRLLAVPDERYGSLAARAAVAWLRRRGYDASVVQNDTNTTIEVSGMRLDARAGGGDEG